MILGLVGKICVGKSLFTELLAERDFFIIELDLVGRALDSPGSPYNLGVKKLFGPRFLLEDGRLDRRMLKLHVFESPERLTRLNALVQPLIRDGVDAILEAERARGRRLFVLVGPILFQVGLDHLCRFIVEIACRDEILLERIQVRDNLPFTDAKNILKAQEAILAPGRTGTRYRALANEHSSAAAFEESARQFLDRLLAEAGL